MIANNFNNYVASIGPNMANNIPTANCHFSNYLKNSSLNSMFIPPAIENEITDIISNLKITKPCDSFELPINIIKRNAHNICKPLTHLVNQSFLTGIVALGTTTIDSTPTIDARWRRVPIRPAKYLHQWLSVKLVQTGFQNSGPFVSNHKGLITFDADTGGDGTHRGHRKDRKNDRA